MKLKFLVLFLSHLQGKGRVCEKDQLVAFVLSQKLLFDPFKVLEEGGFFITFYPARFVDIQVFKGTLGTVFVEQAVLNDFKLQSTHGTNDLASVEVERKQLGHPFVHQLVNAFGQLFGFHGVFVIDVAEVFWGKARNSFKLE